MIVNIFINDNLKKKIVFKTVAYRFYKYDRYQKQLFFVF